MTAMLHVRRIFWFIEHFNHSGVNGTMMTYYISKLILNVIDYYIGIYQNKDNLNAWINVSSSLALFAIIS